MSNISCLSAPSAFSISTAMPMLLHSSRLSMTSSYQSCRPFFPSRPSLFPSIPVTLTSSLTSLWISQTALTSSQSGPSSDQTSAETTSDRAPGFCPCSHPENYFIQLPFYFSVKLLWDIISRLCFKSLVSLPFTRNGIRNHVLCCYFYLF